MVLEIITGGNPKFRLRNFNGFVQGVNFVANEYIFPIQRHSESDCQDIDVYRDLFYSEPHHHLEMESFAWTNYLIFGDVERALGVPTQAVQDQYRNPNSHLSRVQRCASDHVMVLFPYDDLIDNAPLRAMRPSYHILTSPEHVTRMYSTSSRNMRRIMAPYGDAVYDKIDRILSKYDEAADDENSDHYFKLDLEGEHTPQTALDVLHRKAKYAVGLNSEAVLLAAGIRIPDDWKEALVNIYEASWMVNDHHKNLAYPGLGHWMELKTGRVPLSVTLALSLADPSQKQQLMDSIYKVWDSYYSHTSQKLDRKILNELIAFDSSREAQDVMRNFDTVLNQTGVEGIIEKLMAIKARAAREVSRKYGGLHHLDYYQFLLSTYFAPKKLLIGFDRLGVHGIKRLNHLIQT